jgi:thiamine-monophosphate kinase
LNEFELIRTYFAVQGLARDDVVISIGDDAAVVRPQPGMEEVLTTDMLVADTHFFADADPRSIGYKSLAVNLSDLAAMGAEPAWFTLDLSLPRVDPSWLEAFTCGLFELAARHRVQLVGGDTVRGPLAVAIQLCGFVPAGTALRRTGACAGDCVYVTGTLGDAALALLQRQGELTFSSAEREQLQHRLDYPEPRLAIGTALRAVATSCIDVSDGLLADLGHVLEASAVGARIALERIPFSKVYRQHRERLGGWDLALTNGDDYELCFTVPRARQTELESLLSGCDCEVSYVGDIEAEAGLRIVDVGGELYAPMTHGYEHFSTE